MTRVGREKKIAHKLASILKGESWKSPEAGKGTAKKLAAKQKAAAPK